MADEQTIKRILDAQKEVQAQVRAMEATSRSVQPMVESIKALEKIQGLEEMVRKASAFSTHFSSLMDQEWIKKAAVFEARFRLPEMPEIALIMKEWEASKSAMRVYENTFRLQEAIEKMQVPWLDMQEKMRSLTGFAELQNIGLALANIPAFDEKLAAALRVDLGDWRDNFSWPEEIGTDSEARSAFYESRGFNKELTDFPPRAFAQSLEIAGLRPAAPTLVTLYGDPLQAPAVEDKEDENVSPHTAYDWLFRLESQLRAFIDEVMTEAFGSNWPKHHLPPGLHEKWKEKKQKAETAGAKKSPIIAYADFTDYERIISRAYNWSDVFSKFYVRQEDVLESFRRLYPIRLSTMHARPITQDDELYLFVESRRLMSVIKR
jgi:hypothetical protein